MAEHSMEIAYALASAQAYAESGDAVERDAWIRELGRLLGTSLAASRRSRRSKCVRLYGGHAWQQVSERDSECGWCGQVLHYVKDNVPHTERDSCINSYVGHDWRQVSEHDNECIWCGMVSA